MPTLASQADKRVMTRYFGEAFQLFLLIALVAQKPLGTRRIERKITSAMCPSRLILESNKINKTEVRSVTITVMIASIRHLTTLIWFPHKTYIWQRVRITPHLLNPSRLWKHKGLEKRTDEVGMLYGFRITPPGLQEERREDRWRECTEGLGRCQSQTPPVSVTRGATNTRRMGCGPVPRKGGTPGEGWGEMGEPGRSWSVGCDTVGGKSPLRVERSNCAGRRRAMLTPSLSGKGVGRVTSAVARSRRRPPRSRSVVARPRPS